MSNTAPLALAELAEEAAPDGPQARLFFATVTAATSTTVTVLPDDSDSTEIGPLVLVGSAALAVDDRCCCIRTPGGVVVCVGKVVT